MISAGVYSRQLIGRSRELAFLVERAQNVAKRGGIVLVRGDAGIGKSRIIRDFAAIAREHGAFVAIGSAHEYANHPYDALADALSALGTALPPALDAGADARAHWYGEVAAVLDAAVTAHGPTVLILEDLHWADAATIDLARFCAERLALRPLLIVGTYREEDVESDTGRARAIAALASSADIVTLAPLAPGQIEHLLTSVLRDLSLTLSTEVIAAVRDLADGRPLFAEEMLRGALERAERSGDGGAPVPTSIRASVRERMLAMDEGARNILVHAAVFGRRFSAAMLAKLLDIEITAIYAALRRARDLQLIAEDSGDDDDRFVFRHALTREAIYGEMLRVESRSVHERLARMLAADPQADASEIAEHAFRARDNPLTAQWCERAGDAAFEVFSYRAAAQAYERAYEAAAEPRARASVALRGANARYAVGDLSRAIEGYQRSADASSAAREFDAAAQMRIRRARMLFEQGRTIESIAALDALIAEATTSPGMRIEAQITSAGLVALQADANDVLRRLAEIDGRDPSLNDSTAARIASTYGHAFAQLGRAAEGRASFTDAAARARAANDRDLLLRVLNNWGRLELTHGSLGDALRVYDEALTLAQGAKDDRHVAVLATNRGLIALLAGDLASASDWYARAQPGSANTPMFAAVIIAQQLRLSVLNGGDEPELLARAEALYAELRPAMAAGHLAASVNLLAAALADAHSAARRKDAAVQLAAETVPHLAYSDVPYWAFELISQYAERPARDAARSQLALLAATGAGAAGAYLDMHDAREAFRARDRAAGAACAARAEAAFTALGWHVDAIAAVELAGRTADAIAGYRAIGAEGAVRRLTEIGPSATRRRGEATLTARERDIAGLLVGGHSAKAIAEALVISERTVETHTASIYRKLGVAGRRELSDMFREGVPS